MTSPQTASGGIQQRQLGTLTVIGWSGEHPEDGRDMAFLLAYSLGDGPGGPEATREAARRLLEETGLPVGGELLDGTAGARLPLKLLVEAGKAVLTMPKLTAQYPVTPEWLRAARERGHVYFMFATRPWPEGVPGAPVSEEALQGFVDEEMMASSAHCVLPVQRIGT